MATAQPLLVGYGLTQALSNLANLPIIAKRAPTTADKAQLGTEWINTVTNTVYFLTSVVNNSATWTAVGGGGGAGVFLSVTSATFVTAGTNITSLTGNITATLGNIVATAGNITATAGDIVATAGTVRANTGGFVSANGDANVATVVITGDTGNPVANNIQLSNVIDTTQGAGVGTILTTTGNPVNNSGFFKIYHGVTTSWVPFFDNIAP